MDPHAHTYTCIPRKGEGIGKAEMEKETGMETSQYIVFIKINKMDSIDIIFS